MLIRRPVSAVFEAFVDPEVTTRFWFTESTGKLEKGKEVTWTWGMYEVSSPVRVIDLVTDQKIAIDWGTPGSNPIRVTWIFEAYGPEATFVSITVDGITGTEQEVLTRMTDTVGGFCWVLAGLKAYLEFDIQLNLVGDRFPNKK